MRASDATSPVENFAESAAAAAALGWAFRHVSSTGSTNADLVAEARAGDRTASVLTAEHQTAGRGRLDRSWHDDGQSQLMVSLRLPVDGGVAPWVAGAVAASARAAVASFGAPAAFKWPNDLVIEHGETVGKLAGVLAEFVPGPPDAIVVGMGLNVAAPGIEGAASLYEVGARVSRDQILAATLAGLPPRLADPDRVRDELSEYSATLGRRVRVEQSGGELVGDAVSIDGDGRLVLDVDGTHHTVSVGDVVHLRPASG